MTYLGDFAAGSIVDFKWNAFSGLGGSITRATNGSIRIYKGNSVTQRSSASGITDSEDFDSLTGLNHVRIDLADDADPGFYAAGSEYQVVLQGAVIDGQTINAVLAHFSIERTGGLAAIKEKTDALPSDPADQSLIIAATDALAVSIAAIATANQNADALLDRADGVETGLTPRQALRLALAVLAGAVTASGDAASFLSAVSGAKTRLQASGDGDGNRAIDAVDLT